MNTTVTLDEKHFRQALERARELGLTPEAYIQSLIAQASRTFDEILEPIRRGFDAMSDDEVDRLFERAQKSARASR